MQRALIKNVTLLGQAVDLLVRREAHLPGIAVMSGPSGYGKSWAAAHAVAVSHCYYVEARSDWSRGALLRAVNEAMGLAPAERLEELRRQVGRQLMQSGRCLIIDEADHIIARQLLEAVRDIYEESQGSVLLIGEEQLPTKLLRYERFHNRVLEWVQAVPLDADDARRLAKLYCPGIELADDLMAVLLRAAGGRVRRLAVNLARILKVARDEGLRTVSRKEWGERALYTGMAPEARRGLPL